ncbi:MAG: hypothetical protein HQL91_13870, partial [Magnetococcales bacterium]|nr:hypothetical protein [Magnetococcales bacterium]
MSTPSLPPVAATDSHYRAIAAIQSHTTYLWQSLASLASTNQTQCTCPIRQSTYQKIHPDLMALCKEGFFEFNLLHSTSATQGGVTRLEISAVSDSFKKILRESLGDVVVTPPRSTANS